MGGEVETSLGVRPGVRCGGSWRLPPHGVQRGPELGDRLAWSLPAPVWKCGRPCVQVTQVRTGHRPRSLACLSPRYSTPWLSLIYCKLFGKASLIKI